MLNADLMSGASLEALAMLLVSSYALAERALGEPRLATCALREVGAAVVVAASSTLERRNGALAPADAPEPASASMPALRRAEARRWRGASRCVTRARVRRVIRIRGRR